MTYPARAVGPGIASPGQIPDSGRRPLQDWERPHLRRLGAELRLLRVEARMTQAGLAVAAGIAERSLRRIEHGERRTRRSTIERLSDALANAWGVGLREHPLHRLLVAAGPVLAAESPFAERVAARRARRRRQQAKRYTTLHVVVYEVVPEGILETHTHRWRISRTSTRERRYTVLRTDCELPLRRATWARESAGARPDP